MSQPKGTTTQLTSNAEVPTRYGGPTASGGNVTAGMHANVGQCDSANPLKEEHLTEVAEAKATEHRSSFTSFKVFCLSASTETGTKPKVNDATNEVEETPGVVTVSTIELAKQHRIEQKKQVELFIETSNQSFTKLKDCIVKQNEDLVAMKHQKYGIPQGLVSEIEQLLVHDASSVGNWVIEGNEELEKLQDKLFDKIDEYDSVYTYNLSLENKVSDLTARVNEMTEEAMINAKTGNLSDMEKAKLALWGCETVFELCNKMTALQNQNRKLVYEVNDMVVDKQSQSSKRLEPQLTNASNLTQVKPPRTPLSDTGTPPKGNHSAIDANRIKEPKAVNSKWPMPSKFTGRTRGELERYLVTYESSTGHNGIYGDDKAELLAHYLPSELQQHHYNIFKQTQDYEKVKHHLLNALGSENSIAMFTSRAGLDRMKKPFGQSYAEFLREVENKVAEAFAGDNESADIELKKILIRVTQTDRDMCYYNIILPQSAETYLTLKQLVLSTEVTRKLTYAQRSGDHYEGNKRPAYQKNEGNGNANFESNTRLTYPRNEGNSNAQRFSDGRNSNYNAGVKENNANVGNSKEAPRAYMLKNNGKGFNVFVVKNYVIPPNKRFKIKVTAPIEGMVTSLICSLKNVKLGRVGAFKEGKCHLCCTNTSDKKLALRRKQVIGKVFSKDLEGMQFGRMNGDETSLTSQTTISEGDGEDDSSWYKSLNVDADTLPVINNQIDNYREQPLTSTVKELAPESSLFNGRLESLTTVRKPLNGSESNKEKINQAKEGLTSCKETTKSFSAPWWDNFICIRNNDSLSIEKTSSTTEATNPQLNHVQEMSNSDVVKGLGIAEMDNYAHHQKSSTQIEATNAPYVNENEWKQDALISNGIKSTMEKPNTVDHRSVNNRGRVNSSGYAQQHRETSRKHESQINPRSSKQLYGLDDPIYYGNRRGRRAHGGRGESYRR